MEPDNILLLVFTYPFQGASKGTCDIKYDSEGIKSRVRKPGALFGIVFIFPNPIVDTLAIDSV